MTKQRTTSGLIALILCASTLLLPQSPANAWPFSNKCKTPIASANKAARDTALLSRVILNNKSCFDPLVVANAQICVKLDYSRQSTLGILQSNVACGELPRKFK